MPAYKDAKSGTWYAKFNYKDWKGKTRFTTKRGFATKREAVAYESDFKLRISDSLDMKFKEFIELYRAERYPRIRPSTVATKDAIIDTKIMPFFGNIKMKDITAKSVIRWQNELLSYRNPETGEPYSKTYLRTVHADFSAIMNFAVRYYNLSDNPARKAGSIGLKDAEEMNFWTLEEYTKFSEAIMEEPFYYYCFEVLYWTGMRVGELLALKYEDFDFESKTISITKTYQIIKGKEIIGPPKTSKGKRIIHMPDTLCDEMQDYFRMCIEKTAERAFPTSNGVLAKALARWAENAGIKRIRVHDLRHSHISLLINLGYSAVDIASRVGHESITITLRYAHMFPSVQAKMTNELNNLMKNNSED